MLKHKDTRGFTLLELLICCAIIAILALVGIALYTPKVRSSRRADAFNSLSGISLAEEQYRSNNTTYGTLAQVWGGVTTSSEGYYTLGISGNTATAYTITATAVGTQANDSENGVSCSTITMTMSSGTLTRSPSACWPS